MCLISPLFRKSRKSCARFGQFRHAHAPEAALELRLCSILSSAKKVRTNSATESAFNLKSAQSLVLEERHERGVPLEVEIVSLFQYPETTPRQKKSLLNSLIESGSILLTPEQSLNLGGNSLDLLFIAPIRRRRNFSCG
jgi:hypothetical protein